MAASLLVLSACGGDSGAGGGAADEELAPAALVIAQGGLGDESYNDLANSGFERGLEETSLEGNTIESADVVGQGEQILRRAGQEGFGLVIDLEFSHAEILPEVADEFPETNWAIVNAEAEGENVASVLFKEHQGSYLAGALAAMHTSNTSDPKINPEKVIGVIGGTQSVGIDKFVVGFIQGARDVDPEVEVLTAYSNDFANPALGQQLAESMYNQGADIVYAVAGGTGAGVIQAAEDLDRYAIGVDSNQDDIAPGHVLTSMLKHTDVAVTTLLQDYAEGEFPGGEALEFGLEEGGVGLTDFEFTAEQIGQEAIARIDELEQQVIDGEIEVWNVVEQGYPDFYSGS